MARQVIWSLRAQDDKKNILAYWRQRNKSNTYSKKFNLPFKEAVNTIKDFPQIGKQTDDNNSKIKIVRDYQIIYEETESTIYILTIWDCRQDPVELEKVLK